MLRHSSSAHCRHLLILNHQHQKQQSANLFTSPAAANNRQKRLPRTSTSSDTAEIVRRPTLSSNIRLQMVAENRVSRRLFSLCHQQQQPNRRSLWLTAHQQQQHRFLHQKSLTQRAAAQQSPAVAEVVHPEEVEEFGEALRGTVHNRTQPKRLKSKKDKNAYEDEIPSTSASASPLEERADFIAVNEQSAKRSDAVKSETDGVKLTYHKLTAKSLPGIYARLVKARLTGLVVVTEMAGYGMCTEPLIASTFLLAAVGTTLLSSSANSLNQFLEVPYDSQMKRTQWQKEVVVPQLALGGSASTVLIFCRVLMKNGFQARPLVLHQISPLHALTVATTCCIGGFTLLYTTVNPLTAYLGLSNVLLYAGVYTPMKRYSIGCTWAGSVVGAIPPLMGWAACLGPDPSFLDLGLGAGTMAAILYAWQFPHFNSLSWNLRPEYSRAGYRVMCVSDPGLCLRTSLRYSGSLIGLCSIAAPVCHLTTWAFAATSLPFNVALTFLSYKFYNAPDSKNSRQLFRFTLLYLPAVMLLMFVHKPSPQQQQQSTATSQSSSPSAAAAKSAEISS